jgi:hypothetical protein
MAGPPVVVYPPSPTGGRRVRVDGEILGLAHSADDLIEILHLAGLEGVDETDVRISALIEWRGGGPEVWTAPK